MYNTAQIIYNKYKYFKNKTGLNEDGRCYSLKFSAKCFRKGREQ